jgi:hypothetical protein
MRHRRPEWRNADGRHAGAPGPRVRRCRFLLEATLVSGHVNRTFSVVWLAVRPAGSEGAA